MCLSTSPRDTGSARGQDGKNGQTDERPAEWCRKVHLPALIYSARLSSPRHPCAFESICVRFLWNCSLKSVYPDGLFSTLIPMPSNRHLRMGCTDSDGCAVREM